MKPVARKPFAVAGLEGGLGQTPFCWLRISLAELERLRARLAACAAEPRRWFTLVVTYQDPTRLRLKRDPTPAYEKGAARIYLRGDQLRIQGRPGQSCNVNFSSAGAGALADRIDAARSRSERFVELRIQSRRRHVVEFIPDRELPPQVGDADLLSRASAAAGARALGPDDFSDWTC